MVWHAHMLNPRAFLEDAMLAGLRHFWTTGMPWDLVNSAIDNTSFSYNVSDDCKARWVQQTGLNWDNTDDPLTKEIRCPRCAALVEIPWTTCGLPEDAVDRDLLILTGNGYGDSDLQHACPLCGITICKELLSVAKFVADTKALLGPHNRPMPGTVLDPIAGTPKVPPDEQTFPNRLLKSGCNSIRSRITELITSGETQNPTIKDVVKEIETVVKNRQYLKEIQSSLERSAWFPSVASRIAVRKMMSRYWENFSPFALDLAGAVMRQGRFVEKMCQLDWLHSPSARGTMSRLIAKYGRFFDIMVKGQGLKRVAVPTLDVDLAWHTHQLSPSKYFAYSLAKTKPEQRFIDHDDKIDEHTLSIQFKWTSKVYQERYGEVYSECTCWYCECEVLRFSRKS